MVWNNYIEKEKEFDLKHKTTWFKMKNNFIQNDLTIATPPPVMNQKKFHKGNTLIH